MKRLAPSILLYSLLLFCACESVIDYNDGSDAGPVLVDLDISVALSDVSDALTRADADAANDNEKMHTLRVIIVRPDWTVEANRLIDHLKAAATLQHEEKEPFRVVSNERKMIYLFVNEDTEVVSETGTKRKLLDCDLNAIRVGQYFPINDIETLTLRLEGGTEQITGPLPMSEKHSVEVDVRKTQSCSLFVTRAAVKFTFRIINKSSNPINLNGLTIDKMAREEWYMPRAKYGAGDTKKMEITEYEVPAGVGYYTYGEAQFAEAVTVNANGERVLDPIYLLEGKYTNDPDGKGHNYSMMIRVNNIQKKHYFPELNTLPRNTHVVVNITFNKDATVTCETDVIPYSEVLLDPDFGL